MVRLDSTPQRSRTWSWLPSSRSGPLICCKATIQRPADALPPDRKAFIGSGDEVGQLSEFNVFDCCS